MRKAGKRKMKRTARLPRTPGLGGQKNRKWKH
jgi:hypothetical protein